MVERRRRGRNGLWVPPPLHLLSSLLLTLLLLLFLPIITLVESQVPGLVYTTSGYDNLNGHDAICWSAPRLIPETLDSHANHTHQHNEHAYITEDFQGKHWKNGLVPNFMAGHTTMLPTCPAGSSLHLDLLPDTTPNDHDSTKLRTQQYYTFQFTLLIDLHSIRQEFGLRDDAFFFSVKHKKGKPPKRHKPGEPPPPLLAPEEIAEMRKGWTHPQIAIQLQFCPVSGNLCSPFVFEGTDLMQQEPQLLDGRIQTGVDDDVVATDDELTIYDDYTDTEEGGQYDDDDHSHDSSSHDDNHRQRRRLRYRQRQPNSPETTRHLETHTDAATQQHSQSTAPLLTESPAPTITELFDRIDEALDLYVDPFDTDNNNQMDETALYVSRVQVQYHDVYGFPEHIVIDYQRPQQNDATAGFNTRATVISLNDDVYLATITNLQILGDGEDSSSSASAASSNTNTNNGFAMTGLPSHHMQLLKLAQAKALWNASDVTEYSYEYNVHYDGLPHIITNNDNNKNAIHINRQETPYPWNVTVYNGQVQRVVDAQNTTLFDPTAPSSHGTEGHPGEQHTNEYWQLPVAEQPDGHMNASTIITIGNGTVEGGGPALAGHSVVMDNDDHDNATTTLAEHAHDSGGDAASSGNHQHNQNGDDAVADDDNTGDDDSAHFHDDDDVAHIYANVAKETLMHADNAANNEHAERTDFTHGAAASPVFYIEIERALNKSKFQIHYNIDIQVKEPGDYLPLATVMFFMSNDTETPPPPPGQHHHPPPRPPEATLKFDIANLLDQRSLTYFAPIKINDVSDGVAIATYVIIGLCAAVQLFFLVESVRHRNDNVMKLSQITPIILLQVASLVAILGTISYRPTSNWSCIISGPLKFIPLQFVFAIIFGRLRRIITIMAPLMDLKATDNKRRVTRGLRNWKTVMMLGSATTGTGSKFTDSHGLSTDSNSTPAPPDNAEAGKTKLSKRLSLKNLTKPIKAKRLRQEYSEGRLWCLIVVATLPMIIAQIISLILYPLERVLILNEDESVGRYECGDAASQAFELVSAGILFITIMVDLYEAQRSNSLPAFFNESAALSSGVLLSMFVFGIGICVIILSGDPTGDPNLTFMMEVLIVIFMALNVSLRLIVPKLKLIWKGEKVVVSKMLQEHKQQEKMKEQKAAEQDGPGRNTVISGLSNNYDTTYNTTKSDYEEFCHDNYSIPERATVCQPEEARPLRRRLVVTQGQAPPSKLTMQVVTHSNKLSRINDKVLAGFQIDSAEWMDVKASVEEFQALMETLDFQ